MTSSLWKHGVAVALLTVSLTDVALARPSVFVKANQTPYPSVWYNQDMEGRILGKSVGQITTEQLDQFIANSREYGSYKVCSVEAVQADTYVGMDRDTQEQIDNRQNGTWGLRAVTPDGRALSAQTVLWEGCDGEESGRGVALLVTDEKTSEILTFEPMYGGDKPLWVLFLHPKTRDELFAYSDCTECGSLTRVYYDVTRRKIYSEYNGH